MFTLGEVRDLLNSEGFQAFKKEHVLEETSVADLLRYVNEMDEFQALRDFDFKLHIPGLNLGKALDILISALNRSEHNEPVKSHGVLYSAADIYFSAITPSASGGQPASAFFMSRDGISMAQSAVILVTNMLLYTISLAIIGVFGFISSPYVFMGFDTPAKVLIIIGSVFIIAL